MAEEDQEEQKARAGQQHTRKLLGNHNSWVAGSGGFEAWEALDVDAALESDVELLAGRSWELRDLFAEDIYRRLLPLSHNSGGMSLEVFETAYGGEFSFCDRYPYIVAVYFGQPDLDSVNTYFVFCPSFPIMLTVLAALRPLVQQFGVVAEASPSLGGS